MKQETMAAFQGRALEDAYAEALAAYLNGEGEGALRRAYELGRSALAGGLGLLEMAAVHHAALEKLLPRENADKRQRETSLRAAAEFLTESLAAFEMAHRAFREANAALRRINETLEQETKRIAHSLHDEVGQLLVCLHLALETADRSSASSGKPQLEQIRKLVDQLEEQLRSLVQELRPTILDDLGLVPALEFLAERISKHTGLPVTVEASLKGRLPGALETAVYRIVQEALTNVTKHSKASRVGVQVIRQAGSLRCSIGDDGIGFSVAAVLEQRGERGLGLIGIQERLSALGGTLQLKSEPGSGTEVQFTIPIEE